ncbi:MAG: type I restriction-modification system subunit M [Burkholderiaceae bacterium]|jgi:type I restriction enzyme M protein|nr:type I restriction-modification system subunit M [Burkholderiaceae bacterium]
MNLSSTIKSIQDIMRKDDGVDGDAQRLGQLTWMLFLKVFDQREQEWEDNAKEAGKKYKSPLGKDFRWRNWAAYITDKDGKKKPQTAASEIISFVNNDLFPALKYLAGSTAQHKVIRSVFEDANNYMKSGTQLLAVIEKLEEAIDFNDFKNRTQLGDVYEQLLNDLRGAGNAGEFYTPRAITQFMVDRVNPCLQKRETVLDPACGTGGFLTATIEHFNKQISAKSKADDKKLINTLIRGIEKKQFPHLLCTTNMLLHGIDVPSQIEHRNTLSVGWNDWRRNDFVDCIITNPPFGGYEDDTVGSGYHHPTKETADLFMQLIVKLLKEHGRAAVVLPDGFLFGDGIKAQIKERLLQQCKLHTIVRLPKGVFAPYTTIKTNLLFFTKGEAFNDGSERFHTETIWFYEHPYPPGYKSYSKTKPIRFEEFAPEIEWWGEEADDFSARTENAFAWKVNFKAKREQAEAAAQPHWHRAEQINNEASALENKIRDLRNAIKGVNNARGRQRLVGEIEMLRPQAEGLRLQARDAKAAGDRLYWPIYNLDLKNPNAPEEESHDPDVLLEKYKTLLGEIEETENRLKGELAAALAHHFGADEAQA